MKRAPVCLCKHEMSAVELLDIAQGFGNPSLWLLAAVCPACGRGIEFKPMNDGLEAGYTYWAGSMHFEGVLPVPCRGLKVDCIRKPQAINLWLGDCVWRFAAPDPGRPAVPA